MFKRQRPYSVFYYYFFSFLAALAALLAWAVIWPEDVPARNDLVMTGGEIKTIRIHDNISDTGAGAMFPVLSTVYFRLKGIEGEFRYPWTFPYYSKVKDQTGGYVDIWVEESALGRDEVPLIWALQEINSYKDDDRQISVRFEDVAASQEGLYQKLIKFCLYMAGASVVFGFLGYRVGRWNRRNFPDYDPN